MGVIRVLEPGLFTTVQDLGRERYGPLGVSASGSADAVSLRVGNRLVSNGEDAAGLEMTLLGGTFLFDEGAVVALSGSDFGAALDGVPVGMWASFEARAGQTLRAGPTRSGARCYLCVRGGIAVKPFLGSASTHVLSGLGGFEGRALRKGDVLEIGADSREGSSSQTGRRRLSTQGLEKFSPQKTLRVTAGPQSDWFSEEARRTFYEGTFRVSEESNRMGIRLEGDGIAVKSEGAATRETGRNACSIGGGGEMISEGVALGAVQVPESGLPIILFVEQQTTGGYPKIANVISADFHSLGQLRPRDEIRFELVDMETARRLLRDQEELLASPELVVE
jgi:antagonist of KipI